ncbi:ATP-binding protein [Thiothrix sp.]|jgi:AAA15 family ATPase/GTPase|uniref:AAA family ATPase n=1 Tax=Thiothrix sp. TaxID=1032 RepID=UPI00257C0643|nr:ATP-binding protein [Thiothrix sp.]
MITELRLENWKSFGEATLYIDPLSILIGTNASGKSNVLDALIFLQRIASGSSVHEILNSLRGGIEWASKKPGEKFTLSLSIQDRDDIIYKYQIQCGLLNEEYCIEFEKLSLFSNHIEVDFQSSVDIRDVSFFYVILAFAGLDDEKSEWEKIVEKVFDCFCNIFVLSPKLHSMVNYSSLASYLKVDASNIAGVLAALSPEWQKEIEDTLTQYVSRLPERDIHRVYAEKVGKLGKDAMLYCDEKWGESGEVFTVDARAMSDGTLRFLAILTALLTLPEGSLLAIDEVDNGFHPSRAHLLLEALQTIGKQRNIDVLVTTHNPALLDALGTEFVPFVTVAHRDSITGESKLTLLEDIEQLPKLLAQGTVGKLSTQGLIEKSLESVHG